MLRFVLCCCLLWWSIQSALAQRIDIQIYGAENQQLQLELRWLGEFVDVPLKQIGSAQVGAVNGELIRFLPIRLWLEAHNSPIPKLAFDGIVPVYLDDQVIYLHLNAHNTAQIQSGPGTLPERQHQEALQIGGFALTFMLVFALVWWVARAPRGPPLLLPWPNWASPLLFLMLAVMWTWPAVLSGPDFFVGRHHDALGTIWFLDQAQHWVGGMDPNSAWPLGANYQRMDSFLLWPISFLSGFIHPATLHGGLLCIGIFLSGWAAAYSARQFGARAPWHMLAGLTFVGGGVAATVALEGHIYQILNPFMPLMLAFWWKACGPLGTPKQALAAGLFFVLSLLTSAYIGLSAALVVMVIWIGRSGWRQSASWMALLPVVPALFFYLLRFFGATDIGLEADLKAVSVSSATLENLLGASSDVDRASHSLSVGLLPLSLALACLLPRISSRRNGWPVLWGLVVVALIFSMGTELSLNASDALVPLPLMLLRQLPGFSLLDFPLRLSWALFLGLGIMSALAASQLAERGNKRLWLILGIALIEPIVLTRLPSRQRLQSTEAPSAMLSVDGPILSLYPESLSFGFEYDPDLLFTALSCLFQTSHQQPIADNCISVDVAHQPRASLGRWVHQRLMAGEGHAVKTALSNMGFAALAIHPDLYAEGDSIRLLSGLDTLHSEPMVSKDAGLWTQVYPLDGKGVRPSIWTPLASPVVAYWGAQETTVALTHLRVALLPDDPKQSYMLRVWAENKALGTIPFRQLSTKVAQSVRDGRLYAEWTVPTQGPLNLKVEDTEGNIHWEGAFRPATAVDALFIRLPDGPSPLVPTGLSPPINPMGGIVALLGWGGIALLGLAIVLAIRRR